MNENYNPSAPGVRGSVFGLPYSEEEAKVILLPVPWDVTTSSLAGTSLGPQAILDASPQLDLELFGINTAWKIPIWMAPISEELKRQNDTLRKKITPYLHSLENPSVPDQNFQTVISKVNEASLILKQKIKNQSSKYLEQEKIVGIVGGEHSVPLGLIEALAERHDEFGILQIDAHMDLRNAYEGFTHSHASIMYNAMELAQISKLVQVGIRDYCQDELDYVKASNGSVEVCYDDEMKFKLYQGLTWDTISSGIVKKLPKKVYISFDVDGLNPHLCTGTGTPVPGGLEFQETIYLIRKIVESGRKIIGFDLCEVAPKVSDNDWNGNVGARILYNLCCFANQ